MPNNITLPKGIQAILDEVYRQASVTSVLTSPPSQLKPTQNVHEFCYPQMEVGGLGDYDRASGYTANSGVNLVWKTVTADYDRGTKIMVDEMDNQESFDLAFGQAANILMREHVAPEGDAFTFAKIAALTGITNNTDTIADGAQFLEAILTATTEMDENEVPEEQRYLFTTSTHLKSVKALDTTKSREALDGFAGIVKVPRGRFNTAIDLLSGRDGNEIAGGWKPSELSKPINFLIVHKPALIKFDRHVAGPTVIGPDMNPDADASIVKYRKYGVVDGYENKRAGIYLSHQ
ncbi:hypothetical protein ADLECEL_24410 [Adlercreutzia equolifaciens subsp. celatus]|uniref:Capsid protein n=1 Tax=Adlercreutzia equolifaciens subsp. celatus DSM 18785 TaxID=1121021 RepID=A0A3N0AN68_9ACTN|nr:hypothetical protein [Adlercreutzia equolifaciens]MCP2078680.1 hypothetical protein [Adlercreutzia equolifaciens subsp. celatus DSM 18785]RFT93193.1 hypothetical protein DX904_04760 [Adlercreutzia equolifaciens subsp. celatus]RNL36052.1 hypothetical protein DMP10_11325 [Adlercreutzia equolifaciens subsp. celatus DSM 18785]BCS58556.1 hypothetical protein ADLECEL_24410 [Adlercreutzia equolifaciens subsp. celatus]